MDKCFSELYSNPRGRMGTAEELINVMDQCEVNITIVQNIGWVNNELCAQNNSYILEMAAKYSDRLLGFCSCNPLDGDKALQELDRCIRSGARGIGELRPDIQGFCLSESDETSSLAAFAKSNNVVVSIHLSEPVGHLYPGKGSVYPQSLYEFASIYPELKIVAAHGGGGLPFYELMPEVKVCLSNVYYDTAAFPYLYRPEIYPALIAMIGNNKLLFGSDWPLMSAVKVIEHIRSSPISEVDYSNIIAKNAIKLLDLDIDIGY